MSKPDFVCIGAQKAATSWLHHMLRENPSVWISPIKELHFFDRHFSNDKKKRIGPRETRLIDKRVAELNKRKAMNAQERNAQIAYLKSILDFDGVSEAWYEHVFAFPNTERKIRGELTPSYLEMPEHNIAFMREFLPDTKLLLIVRSPMERELSQFRMHIERHGRVPEAKEEWAEVYDKMKAKENRGNYSRGIPLFQQAFDAAKLKIMPFGLVKTNPEQLIADVESFIGATPHKNYTLLNKAHHKTAKVDIPEWLLDTIRANTDPEKEFLIRNFGEEFYRQTL